MKVFILLVTLFIYVHSQIVRSYTQTDTTSSTNTIKPFTDVFTCECDYFANSCDVFCCCDTDCTETKRNAWTAQEVCTEATTTTSFFQQCPDESILSLLVSPKGQQSISIKQYSTIFCIDYQMVPYSGYFFVEDKGTTHGTVLTHAVSTTVKSTATTYSRGQNLYSTASGGTTSDPRLPILKPNPFGLCEGTYSARFLEELQPVSCTRQISIDTSGTGLCQDGTALSISYYIGSGTGAPKISAYPSETSSSVTITTRNIIYTDGTTIASGAANPVPTTETATVTGGCACKNAVAVVDYYFTYDTTGVITAAKADFILQTIQSSSSCATIIGLDQSFGVNFQTSASSIGAVPRSGNPGYVIGLPLLVGTSVTTYVNRTISGFRIQGISTNGACTLVGKDYSAYRADLIPKFGQNTSLTCQISITQPSDLDTYCRSTDLSQLLVIYNNFPSTKLVGRFGNSNVHYISDWLTIEQPTAKPVANSTNCALPDDEIYVFYAEFGLESNPLNYIVKVVRRFNLNRIYNSSQSSNPLLATQSIKYIKITSKDL